ncbi:MAG: Glu-tRNA(Gln) amidotransferase subunit GatE, partial [Candidatus Methanomethylophilaceae archaeon]|nr:Glu-tRNA(Gln) amidotransferase subunit GatE [Candidatus Methanomethylophilaceae archaeon]
RQNMLIRIKGILNDRGTKDAAFEPVDVTDIFKDCESKVIKGALNDKGKVIAVRLPGFKGVMNGDSGKLRLGAEMAQRARTKGVKGIFHSDELPNYGIEQSYVDKLRDFLGMNGEFDAFVICAAKEKKAIDALEMAVARANEAMVGVPEETRDPLPDGTSKYSRPLPGAARMYPETDVPPINISRQRMEDVRNNLPELPEEIEARLVKQYGINAQQANQLVRQDHTDMFEALCQIDGMASIAATTLLNTYGELETAGIDTSVFDEERMLALFRMLAESKFAKEALPAILREMGTSGCDAAAAVKKLGLESVDESEAIAIISKIVNERADFVREKGMGAVGGLMGPVMGALRGKLDGKRANEILMAEIKKLL